MERQLRESTAVRAHYYACEAIASGSAAGARDEFMYYCEVQLNCEYNDLVHSRMLQAYHKALGDAIPLTESDNESQMWPQKDGKEADSHTTRRPGTGRKINGGNFVA